MSDRPIQSAPRDSSNARSNAASIPAAEPEASAPSLAATTPAEGPRTQRQFELPPLPTASLARQSAFPSGPSRSTSFSNILNPANQSEQLQQGLRRKASELESPLSRTQLPPLSAESQASVVRSPSLSTVATPTFSPRLSQHGRRILTPRSPALHRAASLSQLSATAGSADAQVSPFPGSPHSRTYTAEPGRPGVPPMPAAALSTGPLYTQSPSIARIRPTREHATYSRLSDERGRSSSLSPRSRYSTRFSLTEVPAGNESGSQQSQIYGRESDHSNPYGGGMPERRTSGIPITSTAGQNSFQMMTLQTTSGTVQLPVEVQAASRVADEKRRRNAGASARFRARRKEKEKESSMTIAKLEMQVKDLSEDVDFYRRERGYLAGIVLQVPGGERHFPRPQSPRHRRPSLSVLGPSRSTSAGYLSDPDDTPPSHGEGRNLRRRTSTVSLSMPDTTMTTSHMPGPSSYAQHYDIPPVHQGPASLMHHPQHRPSLPGPAALLAPAHAQGPPQYAQPAQHAVPWPPYGSGPSSAGPSDPLGMQRSR